MAKKEIGQIKLQIPGGDAKPAPPVGPALGQLGVPIMPFCKEFNAKTQDMAGTIIPVVITVYQDKKAAGIAAGSGEPNKEKVGRVTHAQLLEIVARKKDDLNAHDPEMAARIIAGTARSMGIDVVK